MVSLRLVTYSPSPSEELCQKSAPTTQSSLLKSICSSFPSCSSSPLHLILHKCTLAWCVSLLVSVLWSRGETALHKAACQRHRAICQLLVDAGASLRKTDSKVTQPYQPVIKYWSQARPISICPGCLHDWGFLMCAKSSYFYTNYFYLENCIDLSKYKRLQSPTWVIFTIVGDWSQTIQCIGYEWAISMAQHRPPLAWSKERPVGKDHLGGLGLWLHSICEAWLLWLTCFVRVANHFLLPSLAPMLTDVTLTTILCHTFGWERSLGKIKPKEYSVNVTIWSLRNMIQKLLLWHFRA